MTIIYPQESIERQNLCLHAFAKNKDKWERIVLKIEVSHFTTTRMYIALTLNCGLIIQTVFICEIILCDRVANMKFIFHFVQSDIGVFRSRNNLIRINFCSLKPLY